MHTTWSRGDSAIVPEQTVDLIASLGHARTVGISDHLEFIHDRFDAYAAEVRGAGLRLGMEVNGHEWVDAALGLACDYRIYHCFDRDADYAALERLLASGVPVIIAHPNALDTDLDRVPRECLVEVNNRYVWRCDWERYYRPHVERFDFVIGSDAHQPNWINQTVARYVAARLGVRERLLFEG